METLGVREGGVDQDGPASPSNNRKRNQVKKRNQIEIDQDVITENVTVLSKTLTKEDIAFLKASFKSHFTLESLTGEEA